MICANFKPLKHYLKELLAHLEGVEWLENKNPPKRNNQNNNSSGPKKTKKQMCKRDEDEESQDITAKNASNKKSHKPCNLCKMFGGNAELHTTDHCNKTNLLSRLLDEHKKKCMDKAKKEKFCTMAKAFNKASFKSKKVHKRSIHDSSESESSSDE
eukprot:259356-Ditylum_brightwellii.AAC.2